MFTLRLISPWKCGSLSEEGGEKNPSVCSQALPAPNSNPSTSKPASKQVPSASHIASSPLSPSLPVEAGTSKRAVHPVFRDARGSSF